MAANVKVVARFRPPSVPAGGAERDGEVVVAIDDLQTVRLPRLAEAAGTFTFDRVFPSTARQVDVFEYGIKQTVDDVLQGYNGTIFAYGQTGSGKTHTMMGPDLADDELRGITPRIADQIFHAIVHSPPTVEYLVKVSYMEIYMERVRDLLVPERDNLQVHEDRTRGVYVQGLSEYYVSSAHEVFQILHQGGVNRAVASTRMNTESSRSHSILVFTIQQRSTETGAAKSGALYLVDLAGSEKVGKTGASGQTLEEAKKINRSLSALGMVINALTDGKSSHVPYRDSKLTRILQESLGGNSRTTLIVNCSPTAYNADETLSTLRFGVRAKSIQNNARVNAELAPEELRALLRKASAQAATYRAHADALQAELDEWRAGRTVPESRWGKLRAASPVRGASPTRAASPVREDEHDAQLAALRAELAEARQQATAATAQARAAEAEHSALRLRVDELVCARDDAAAQRDAARAELDAHAAAAAQSRASVEHAERLEAMLADLALEHRPGVDAMLDAVARLAAHGHAEQQADLALLREKIVEEHAALAQQTQSARIAAQETTVVQQQKAALSDQYAALQQRYDLIKDHIGALEHGFRLGDETGSELASLRQLLEEHTATTQLNTSTEVMHLEQLLAIRSEETDTLSRSLDDLRTSHEEQRHAMRLLTDSLVAQGNVDPAVVQRLVDASSQMEKARELVTMRLQEYERMKQQLMQGLRERSEKVVSMEMTLEEMQDQYHVVLHNLALKTQQKKMGVLERHLEQLSNVQRRLVEQNSALKSELGAAERRLAARNERVQQLEDELYAGRAPIAAPAAAPLSESEPLPFGRIAKPLRGGGAPPAPTGAQPARAASPPKPTGTWFFTAK